MNYLSVSVVLLLALVMPVVIVQGQAPCNVAFCTGKPTNYYALGNCYQKYCGCTPGPVATLLPCPIVNGVQTLYDATRIQCFAPGNGAGYCQTPSTCNNAFCAPWTNYTSNYFAVANCNDKYCGCNPGVATLLPCPVIGGVQTLYDPNRIQCFAPGSGYC